MGRFAVSGQMVLSSTACTGSRRRAAKCRSCSRWRSLPFTSPPWLQVPPAERRSRRRPARSLAGERRMARDNELRSGFLVHDYILTFEIADGDKRAKLAGLCEGDWAGDRVSATTWEVSTKLSPDAIQNTLLELLGDGARAVYYYLSDSKRIFRVVLTG